MKTQWQIKDLIDLEYFLHIDQESIDQGQGRDIHARDRHFFMKAIGLQHQDKASFNRRFVIKSWLDQRRETAGKETILPGKAYAEAFRLLKYSLFILGGLSGIGLAFSLLTYTGTAPLNISVYLGMTVLVQILSLMLLGGLFIIRLIRPRLFYSSIIYSVLSQLIIFLTKKFKLQMSRSISGAQSKSLSAILGLIRGKKRIYGSLFYWPIFISAQIFGIGFNLGILGATILRVVGTDMAFGWQSTVQVSATIVHAIVKGMAIPWAWIVPPGLAYPTLAQIEGSRLVLKEGIYHLSTPDLVAWWPFLCFSVLAYGLLPRLLLYLFGSTTQRYILGKLDFTQSACDQLIDRMTTPEVKFGPHTKTVKSAPPDDTDQTISENMPFKIENSGIEKRFIVLVPDDIFDICADKDLKKIIAQSQGGSVTEKIRIEDTNEGETITVNRLISPRGKKEWTHILILQEAWLPPIVESIALIKTIRHHLGDRTPIIVGLIGKPKTDTIFTPVTSINWQTWKTRLMALGDPYLRLERMVDDGTP